MHHILHIATLGGSSLMTLLMSVCLTGCTHKELIEDIGIIENPLIAVDYDWNQAETTLPDGMANLFYPIDHDPGSYWRSDFRPAGGTVRMPKGAYDAVTFNNDTENILFSDIDNISEFSFSTSPIVIGDIPAEQLPFPPQKLYGQPDRMWCDIKREIEIRSTVATDTVSFIPKRITRDYHIEMTDITNLQSALRYYAVLSDLTACYSPIKQRQTGPAVSMGGFMSPLDSSSLSSTVTSFGMASDSPHSRLAVYMWLADGERKVYLYDVTDQILQAPDSMNLVIRVKGPSLPEIKPGEGGGGGGLDVGIDDWDFIDIEL